MLRRSLVLLTVAGLVAAGDVAAQEADARPGVIVVSQNQCDLDTTELNELVKESVVPILDDAVAEGALLDWGVLEHMWGDEWNWLLWYAAEDIHSFHEAYDGIRERLMTEDPEFYRKFDSFCHAHRDNIYGVSMSAGASR